MTHIIWNTTKISYRPKIISFLIFYFLHILLLNDEFKLFNNQHQNHRFK